MLAKESTGKQGAAESSAGSKQKADSGAGEGKKPAREKTTRDKAAGKAAEKNFLSESLLLGRRLGVDFILLVSARLPAFEALTARGLRKKVIVATPSEKNAALCEQKGLQAIIIPAYAFDRFEKVKVALAAGVSSGLLLKGMQVLCITGQSHGQHLDTCLLAKIGEHSEEHAVLGMLHSGTEISSQVLEAVLSLALSVGYEGFEGSPVGTIFVVGDATAVLEKSKQLTLNPFQGYSEDEKNILNPKVRDAIKNFCILDGAFVIREDGVVLAAGRYLRAPEDLELDLPLGLGTRHAAAMAITKVSKSIAFVISKTTGSVRVYKNGELAAELRQAHRRT